MKNVLQLLERSAALHPDKTVFADAAEAMSYRAFSAAAKSVGSLLAAQGGGCRPVAVLLPRGCQCLAAMFGVAYSGNFYTVLDAEMPVERMNAIIGTLQPFALLTTGACLEKARELAFSGEVILYETCIAQPADEALLARVRWGMIDTDPLYALFTSGSTGMPKGAVLSHRNVLSYIEWYTAAFSIDETTVFGSQTPFYFSMSVSDVFSTIAAGATLHIISRTMFSFPMQLLAFLNERRVNTIYWVPSALCIVANWKLFDYGKAEFLQKILFAGEVMPTKQLNYWIRNLPDALFANLFGPTETTDICTYYVVDRAFADDEPLPIGKHCDNCGAMVVREDGTPAADGDEGELYVRGSFLALGYYNNPEKTAAAFVQNPLQNAYPETVYKTGDLVRYNERGELLYLCRRDFQIKHMGYRIELGEIEAAAGAVDGLTVCAVLYDAETDRIVFVYQGKKLDAQLLVKGLAARLPAYMMPNLYCRVKAMPYNANGKIDRAWLKNHYQEL